MTTSSDNTVAAGGKPSKGTPADKRLKVNKATVSSESGVAPTTEDPSPIYIPDQPPVW
jgi:hypothetical protein